MSDDIKLEDLERMIDNLPLLPIKYQAYELLNILRKLNGKGLYIADAVGKILIDRIKRGDIDFKKFLKEAGSIVWSYPTVEYVLMDESVSASIRATEPKLLTQLDNIRKSIVEKLRILIPTDIEPPSLDKVISVPVTYYKTNVEKKIDAKIVEIGECQLEITEQSVTEFYNKLEYFKHDPFLKEVLHYSLPSLFPTESPIDSISDVNPLKSKMAQWEQLKVLNDNSMNIISRRAKLAELSNTIDSVDILKLLRLSYDMIKPSQVIKFEFIGHDKFGYYVLHDCNIKTPKVIADNYSFQELDPEDNDSETIVSPVAHQLRKVDGIDVLTSEMPDLYSLPQISAINSWITHGLLSTFLMRREFLQSICTNPFIGNEEFWGYVQHMMQSQYSLLYSASKPLEADTLLYRGSPHFKEDPVRIRTVIATSKTPEVANVFSYFSSSSLGKIILVPAGTHALDLSNINIREKEVLIFPADDSNLLIEPVELLRNKTKRNTYRIRNANKVGGGKRRRRKTCRK